jgi:hypothetical protein
MQVPAALAGGLAGAVDQREGWIFSGAVPVLLTFCVTVIM